MGRMLTGMMEEQGSAACWLGEVPWAGSSPLIGAGLVLAPGREAEDKGTDGVAASEEVKRRRSTCLLAPAFSAKIEARESLIT